MNNYTSESSIQNHNWVTHILVRMFCGRDDRAIAYRLYKYFRYCDDYIDDPERKPSDKLSFIFQQRDIVNNMYNGRSKNNSSLSAIIKYDRDHQNSFQKIFHEMFDVFEFDARRMNKVSNAKSLLDYSLKLSHAYTTLLVMFLKPEYKAHKQDIQLAHGCHLVHMLRDYYEDQKLGYLNIPAEEKSKLDLDNPESDTFRQWVKQRVSFIEEKLNNGKKTVIRTPFIRIQLIALLYCFRYETIIRQLKANGFQLKRNYPIRLFDIGCLAKTFLFILFQGLSAKFAII